MANAGWGRRRLRRSGYRDFCRDEQGGDRIVDAKRSAGCTSGAYMRTVANRCRTVARIQIRERSPAYDFIGMFKRITCVVARGMAIESGEICQALVVAVEASVHPLFISSFRRLGVLAPEGHGCRPFDRRRGGFIVSEAAAAVCLESLEEPIGRPIVRIDRWAAGGDGTHLTGGDPAAKRCGRLLQCVGGSDSIWCMRMPRARL